MNLIDAYLATFDAEAAGTRALLARVPEGKGDWKPHAKSMTLGALATHVAALPRLGLAAATEPELDFATSTAFKLPDFTTGRALVELFDADMRRLREAVAALTPEDLETPWTLRAGPRVIFELPRLAVLWRITLNHLVHHRGQLTVYLRELEVPLPPLYGPTADEGA
jgi:uncharacterized damage-inducible protein DinB